MYQSGKQDTAASWHGSLNLVYAQRGDATVLVDNHMTSPLKVQRPFYPEGAHVCHSVVLHTAGGMVGGDRTDLNFHLQRQSKALITTAAASKIYRSNGLQARQTIQIKVDKSACLEWLPQETIVFNGAIYRQDLQVELAPQASWISWDITRFGRSARGEKFCTGEWRSHTEVWQQGQPLWIDRQWLPGSEEIINSPHALAGQSIIGSLVWIGQPVEPEIVAKARSLWTTQHAGQAGVTRLTSGLLCRYRGSDSTEVRNWFKSVWQLLRLSYLKRPSYLPRVWQI